MNEWTSVPLIDVIELVGGGTPKTSKPEYWDGNIPWLSVVDFNIDGKFVFDTEKKITQKGLENSSTKLLKSGDIIISARGTVGAMAVLAKPMTFNQSCYGVRGIKGKSITDYIYYLLSNTVSELKKISHGGVFDTITRDTFKEIFIALPPLPEQKAIASVLSSLDDKIDLLHRQNKTLEAMAETLFRQWFVEEAQEDWEEKSLEEITTRITDGAHASPPTVEVGLPMASVKDMYQWGITIDTCRKISQESYDELTRTDCRPLKGDILIAKDGSYLKHVFVAEEDLDVVILSSIAILRPNGKYHPLLLATFLKLDSTKESLENIVTGAVIPRIVLKDFRKFKLIVPPQELQKQALSFIQPLYEKCWKNNTQICTLEKLRDTLLPKLMSGEVRVAA